MDYNYGGLMNRIKSISGLRYWNMALLSLGMVIVFIQFICDIFEFSEMNSVQIKHFSNEVITMNFEIILELCLLISLFLFFILGSFGVYAEQPILIIMYLIPSLIIFFSMFYLLLLHFGLTMIFTYVVKWSWMWGFISLLKLLTIPFYSALYAVSILYAIELSKTSVSSMNRQKSDQTTEPRSKVYQHQVLPAQGQMVHQIPSPQGQMVSQHQETSAQPAEIFNNQVPMENQITQQHQVPAAHDQMAYQHQVAQQGFVQNRVSNFSASSRAAPSRPAPGFIHRQ